MPTTALVSSENAGIAVQEVYVVGRNNSEAIRIHVTILDYVKGIDFVLDKAGKCISRGTHS